MDETKNTAQDSLQDAGLTSGGNEGSTSEKEPETFTREYVEKSVSDALSRAGRDAKGLEQRMKELQKKEESFKTWEQEQTKAQREEEERQLEAARDNPDLLQVFQLKKQLRDQVEAFKKERDTFETDRQSHMERLTKAEATEREIAIFDLAQKYNLDAGILKELNLDPENTEQVAKRLGSVKKPPIKVDSGKTIGGEGMPPSAKGKIKSGWEEVHKR